MKRVCRQAGFTLIELMVVVVIMAIVVAVGMLSLESKTQDRQQQHMTKIQGLLQGVSYQAAFEQRLYLVAPTKTGLQTYKKQVIKNGGAWLEAEQVSSLTWPAELKAQWQVDKTIAQQQNLPQAGWLFWPSGEALSGSIELSPAHFTEGVARSQLSWNEAVQFEHN